MNPKKTRNFRRKRLHARVREKVSGTPERPRLAVNFSGNHIYAQVIDDVAARTLVAVATTEKEIKAKPAARANAATAAEVGKLLAARAKAAQISRVVFDRGGFRYHGKVKALADAVREAGLEL